MPGSVRLYAFAVFSGASTTTCLLFVSFRQAIVEPLFVSDGWLDYVAQCSVMN